MIEPMVGIQPWWLGFVCSFSWKENKYLTIPRCLIRGFMYNNKSLIQIQDLEDQKLFLHLNNHNLIFMLTPNVYFCLLHQISYPWILQILNIQSFWRSFLIKSYNRRRIYSNIVVFQSDRRTLWVVDDSTCHRKYRPPCVRTKLSFSSMPF